jgi:2'-5' RNA ligase
MPTLGKSWSTMQVTNSETRLPIETEIVAVLDYEAGGISGRGPPYGSRDNGYHREGMGSDPVDGHCVGAEGERLNIFALVIYIPPPLGKFLDDLRRELVPHYNPHAHVSVLPPRPLAVPWTVASEQARGLIESSAPFEVELTGVEIFPVTEVIYLEVGAGSAELRGMHTAMNREALGFQDVFPYHPHITLAQEIEPTKAPGLLELGRAPGGAFVQNTASGCWIDLAEYALGTVAAKF